MILIKKNINSPMDDLIDIKKADGNKLFVIENFMDDVNCQDILECVNNIDKNKQPSYSINDSYIFDKRQNVAKITSCNLSAKFQDALTRFPEIQTYENGDGIWNFVKVSNVMVSRKYRDGGKLPPHFDNYDLENDNIDLEEVDIMCLTFVLYLNDDYNDGEFFYRDAGELKNIKTNNKGMLIIFPGSNILHGCRKVVGNKLILTTKLIYQKT